MKRLVLISFLTLLMGCSVGANLQLAFKSTPAVQIGHCYEHEVPALAAWEVAKKEIVLVRHADETYYGYSFYLPSVDEEMTDAAKQAGIVLGYSNDMHTWSHSEFTGYFPKEISCPEGAGK